MPNNNQVNPKITSEYINIQENPTANEIDNTIIAVNTQLFKYYDNEDFEGGLVLALEMIEQFPEIPTVTHSWAADFYEALGEKEEILKILEKGYSQGAWWSKKALFALYNELKDHPTFSNLIKLAEQEDSQTDSKPFLLVRTPANYSPERSYPLVLVLHGRCDSNRNEDPYWKNLLKHHDIILALLQSSQKFTDNHFVWDDLELAEEELINAYNLLKQRYLIDYSAIILAGVSQGSEVILNATFSGSLAVKGLYLVIPSAPSFLDQFSKEETPQLVQEDIRVCIFMGEKDPRNTKTLNIHDFFIERGIEVQLHKEPDIGHMIPENFDQILLPAINFILEE
ncbi:MAG: alpha/beta hydrolase [Candidatus Hodarchaeota archaeon]